MRGKTWRELCAPLIAQVLAHTKDQPETAIRRALIDAYPWGQRANHPYKIWCDEIRRQRRTKPLKVKPGSPLYVHPDQQSLFQ